MKCYTIEDHTTNNCPKDASYKVCSCCSEDHIWTECRSDKGEHAAMAMQCPKRKEVTNRKRKEDKERKTTYTSVSKQNLSVPNIPTTSSDITTIQAKTYSCMLFAMFLDVANPGSCQEKLDEIFEKNNLLKIKITKNPPSSVILGLNHKQTNSLRRKQDAEYK